MTPELGKWSTVGGLGVMVDELSVGLAELGGNVVCISPYYNVNRKGVSGYLAADDITYTGRNVEVWVGSEKITLGVHYGVVNDVHVYFLHNALVFPRPYPTMDAYSQVRILVAFAKGALELLCQFSLMPSVIVTNDWFTGLIPAYARHGHFGDVFNRSDFLHIAHNLDPDYEGRLWPDKAQGNLSHLHGLPPHVLVDPYWNDIVINPTRAALLCSDTWATVSRSYRDDLLSSSPLRALLRLSPHPFAHPNGIPVVAREKRLRGLPFNSHESAKIELQRKYFKFATPDPSIPLFAFVGRITLQKGVHLILQAVDQLIHIHRHRIMFLVGGMASQSDSYGLGCSHVMNDLKAKYPDRVWADPNMFFTDGDLVNIGADFCMMPSMFEPGGIVQQEFFVAGTPVIAFKTGGLKDTVKNYEPNTPKGNGFVFESHSVHDFVQAVNRAVEVYNDKGAYAQLRLNSRASVMDLQVVSKAWYWEFHRLRRCLPPIPSTLLNRAQEIPIAVKLCELVLPPPTATTTTPAIDMASCSNQLDVIGTFTKWASSIRMEFDGGEFKTTLSLFPGTYQFKFILNETVWLTATTFSLINDGNDNFNHVLIVTQTSGDELDELDDMKQNFD
jgi:starch synthase